MSRKQCKRSSLDRFINLINLTTLCYYNANESDLTEFENSKPIHKCVHREVCMTMLKLSSITLR
jgi:hypothetical protein